MFGATGYILAGTVGLRSAPTTTVSVAVTAPPQQPAAVSPEEMGTVKAVVGRIGKATYGLIDGHNNQEARIEGLETELAVLQARLQAAEAKVATPPPAPPKAARRPKAKPAAAPVAPPAQIIPPPDPAPPEPPPMPAQQQRAGWSLLDIFKLPSQPQ